MLGERIKFYRQKLKKTQKDIENVSKIPQTTLSRWENNQGEPTASDLVKLASALKISVPELLDDRPLDIRRTG